MRKLILLFSVAIFGFIIFTGQKSQDPKNKQEQKWAVDPTWLYDAKQTYSASFPSGKVDYVHPVTETRVVSTPKGTFMISPNVRVLPRVNSAQTEVIIVRHPANPLIMFGSSNAINVAGSSLFISEGVYVTTNGGASWFGSDTLQGAPIGNHGGDPGPTIDKDGRIHMTHLGFSTSGMYANTSTNNGLTWSANYTIEAGSVDKNLAGTDDYPSSPFYGRSYCVYTTFSSPYPARSSYTSNGGVSWSTPVTMITPQSGYIARGEDIATGPNGDVYVVWANTVGSNPEDFLSFAKSTNGGVSYTGSNNVVDMNGLLVFNTGFAPYNIRMNSFPRIAVDKSGGPRHGWIYVVASGKNIAPLGTDADIVMWKSTNGGTNWSSGVRVNQDPMNNGKLQFYNAICVDQTGGVNIVYYDNRNTAADSAEVMMSRSIDGGNTFTDVVVSDHRFKPKSVTLSGVAAGYAGDYIGVTSQGTKVWPLWMDDVTGMYNAWTAGVQIASYPLSPFTITSPAAGSRIVTFPGSTTPVTITWDTSATGATYKMIFGNVAAPRRVQINASTNSITTTLGALDDILAAAGFTNTGSASDSLSGQFDIWAYKVQGASGADSLKASNGPRTMTLRRGQVNVAPFALVSPVNNARIVTAPNDNSNLTFSWRSGGPGLKYKFQFDSPTFTGPVVLNIASGNNSFDTSLTMLNSALDGLLNAYGIQRGDSLVGQWRAYAFRGPSDSVASSETRNLTLRRVGSLPLNESFSSTTFPPTEWSLEFTGTQYWTRETPSAFGQGSGSARFKYWSASTGTVQTMKTNVFPNVISGAHYLRFNYAQASYLSGGSTLAQDSLTIQTSTNGGTNWTNLITLKATTTPQTGTNSSTNYSTAASQSEFLAPANNQWGTKIFAMPIGTNQVRFIAGSAFGNNSYLDDITAGGPTGTGTSLTLIPDKFELAQNYPNPFNPATKISFSLPKQSFVTLRIFDITGREVAKLLNEMKPTGVHSVDFNGVDFASGVYFYRIETADFIDTKRMMLIK